MSEDLTVLLPVLNESDNLSRLIQDTVQVVSNDLSVKFLVVDDGSTQPITLDLHSLGSNVDGRILSLGSNLGHQRALAVGLAWLAVRQYPHAIVVMDGDGEDRPNALAEIWKAHVQHPHSVVVAQRRNRTENVRFRFFYRAYRFAFRVLTGHRLDFGNFVLLPPMAMQRLVLMNELWNHFPAAIMRSRLPIVKVPIDRGVRYSGESRMNFTALVNHGLAAIAAFIDAVFVRLLVLTGVLLGLFSLAAVAVIAIRVWGTWGVPGWATTALGLILLGLLQLVGLLVVVTFLTLSMRSSSSPPPIQFAQQYITRVEEIQ